MRGGSFQVGIPLDRVRDQGSEFRVAECANPIRHDVTTAMRTGPLAGNLPSRLRRDVGAGGRLLNGATSECEAGDGPEECTDIHAQARLVELRHEPVELRRDADEDLADDVQELHVLGEDRAMAARAGCEEEILVLRIDE
jgi:hypothetical protein